MDKFSFVWRKNRDATHTGPWVRKHIVAASPEDAVSRMNKHIAASMKPGHVADLDYLFHKIGVGGLHGDDVVNYTLKANDPCSDRVFVRCANLCCNLA